MKKNELEFKETRHIVYDNEKCILEARFALGDPCGNGHCDFNVTGGIYETWSDGLKKSEPFLSGAISDEIKRFMPEYGLICDLHLCSSDGSPMCPEGNGIYFILEKAREVAKSYLRITDDEYEALRDVALDNDKVYFKYMLSKMGIVDRWRKEAREAISLMEERTGKKWDDPYGGKGHFILTDEEKAFIEKKIEEGYYAQDEIKKRREEKDKAEYNRKRADIMETYQGKIKKLDAHLRVDLWMLDHGIENYIYYDHDNSIQFNWIEWKSKVSGEKILELEKEMRETEDLRDITIRKEK